MSRVLRARWLTPRGCRVVVMRAAPWMFRWLFGLSTAPFEHHVAVGDGVRQHQLMHAIGVHIQFDGSRGGVSDHLGDVGAEGRVPLTNRVEDRLGVLRERYHWVVAEER